jgi:hypothetical protein
MGRRRRGWRGDWGGRGDGGGGVAEGGWVAESGRVAGDDGGGGVSGRGGGGRQAGRRGRRAGGARRLIGRQEQTGGLVERGRCANAIGVAGSAGASDGSHDGLERQAYLWPSVAISGHQWPSVAIIGHQWPSAPSVVTTEIYIVRSYISDINIAVCTL